MFRKLLLGTSAVFALWTALDFFFHGVLLGAYYRETAHLWRPKGEEMMVLNTVVVIICALMFTLIYTFLIHPKGGRVGLIFGSLYGAAAGAAMGYGAYAFMPVPQVMAFVWTLTGLVEGAVGGIVVGWLIKDEEMDQESEDA